MTHLFLTSVVVVLIYKTLVFGLSILLKRNDIADVSWGVSFILITFVALVQGNRGSNLIMISLLVIIWGFRLATRIFLRNRKKKEDFRYAKLRKESGKHVLLVSFVEVYVLQGIIAVVVALPIILVASDKTQTFDNVGYIGFMVWLIGFFFEVVGDWQLDKFLAEDKNKGKIMQYGLWRYSRHPNYFGEIVMWWGIFLIAASSGLVAIIGPVVISYLIIKVSGVPMLENKYIGNKDYDEYKRKTSVLLPLPIFDKY